MNDWAMRRKSIYLGVTFLLLGIVVFGFFWKFWYKSPVCNDGIKNGDETGVDCGGSCSLICKDYAFSPIIRWDPRIFEISPGVWSVLVYVENPNTNAEATYLPYTFTLYDSNNQIVATRTSATILPKRKTVGIFEGPINLPQDRRPRRAIFEIGGSVVWQKDILPNPELEIRHSPLTRIDSFPRIEAQVINRSIDDVKNLELVVSIFDGRDNAIAASRTFIDKIAKNESRDVFFTWPKPFNLGERACSKPSNVMLAIDRSGSMASLGSKPPEPLTSVKNAASYFVEQLKSSDRVGLVSFSSQASEVPDNLLSNDFESIKEEISSIDIAQDGTQYTNIYEALRSSWAELMSPRVVEPSSKVIVLLTDGRATFPKNPNGKTEEDDISYAEDLARKEAEQIKLSGIDIFTIGLGNNVSEEFLRAIATKKDNFFYAPTIEELKDIYSKISSDICKEVPARIEITYKVFGSQ